METSKPVFEEEEKKCDHGDYEIEYSDPWTDGEGKQKKQKYYICGKCGKTVWSETVDA